MKDVLERLNAPQIRRDWIADNYKLVILTAMLVCVLIVEMKP